MGIWQAPGTPPSWIFPVFLSMWMTGIDASALACQIEETSSSSETVFSRHIVGPCSVEEKQALAIQAETLFYALQSGKSIDVNGVVIIGDLMLDRLPNLPIDSKNVPLSRIQQLVDRKRTKEGRIIPGFLSIQNSWVQGTLATNLRTGVLLIHGEVIMRGTTFERSIDLSRTIFLAPVDFSDAVIRYEGFFIGSRFDTHTTFEKTNFGTHSRFHKAEFGGRATFSDSTFNGLAEFLEVIFEKDVTFSSGHFGMGTGFSGTRFKGMSDFSTTIFDGEGYFRFSTFEDDVSFRQATFRKVADFTNATFRAHHDFSDVSFALNPNFTGTNMESSFRRLPLVQDPRFQVVIFAVLLIIIVFSIYSFRKK